jgi:putative ABC transport system permease protein
MPTNIKYISVDRINKKINTDNVIISGLDPLEYKKIAFEVPQDSSLDEIFDKLLKEEQNIIISSSFAKSHNLNIKDNIKIDEIEYSITGIISSFENMGKVMFVSKQNFIKYFKPDYTDFLISCPQKEQIYNVKKLISESLQKKTDFNIVSIDELFESNHQRNQIVFSLVSCIILISMLVASIGLINEITINILKQKKSFAIKRAIGFSKTSITLGILFLGLLAGFISGINGIILGGISNIHVFKIISYYIGDLSRTSISNHLYLLIFSTFIALLSSIYPAVRTNSLKLVEEIKRGE